MRCPSWRSSTAGPLSRYYDRLGNPIDLFTWAAHQEDESYKRVALDVFAGPEGIIRVSTVWLGLDHNFGSPGNPPIIFETMIFGWDSNELDCWRYPTEVAALAGHDQVVAYVKNKVPRTS